MTITEAKNSINNIPIAIVGIACRLPGEAQDVEKFWNLLMHENETCSAIPADRFNIERYCANGQDKLHPISKTAYGHFLKDPIDQFDAEFFGISRKEAASMDPQHRLLMESTYHAFEDAGLPLEVVAGTNTAVYVGQMQSHYNSLRTKEPLDTNNQYSYMNTSSAYSAARLSYYFNLIGPSFQLDTMCSSSIVALHLAAQSLKVGECDMAIAAGANLNFDFQDFVRMSIIGAAAKDGRSKAFSANADGYAKGEGIGVVVLKRLDQAIKDNDRIHAVIRGSGVNHDGKRKNGITITSSIGQKDLFERVYKDSNIDPAAVTYLESHTTGTLVGDPIEASALSSFFGKARREAGVEGPVRIGSVKANIGHTEAMSGIASLAKVLMMLKHKQIPPTLLFDKLNPKINFEELNLKVVTSPEALPSKSLIGLSSFGMGGTNGHIIVESYERSSARAAPQAGYLLLLSARRSEKVLIEIAKNLKEFVNTSIDNGADPTDLFTDICHTYAVKRTHHEVRAAIAFTDLEDFNVKIDAFVNADRKVGVQSATVPETEGNQKQKMVFVFSGQGPQWFAMGRHLLASEPVFRASMHRIDKELSKYVDWSLVDELTQKDDTTSRINQTDFAQPGIFAIQVSLYELLKSLSIVPDIVVGHSVGEVASAYVAGALTFEDAILVIYERSRLQHKCSFINKGKMLAVNISESAAKKLIVGLEDKVSVAAVNSATSVTLSGDEEALKQVVEIINSDSALSKASKVYLRTSAAFHSVHMDPIKDELLEGLANIKPQKTTIPLFSTVTGQKISGLEVDGEYWWNNVRGAVLFDEAIKNIMDRYNASSPLKYWIELAPHPVLSSFIKGIVGQYQSDAQVVPTLIRKENENVLLKNTLGSLYIYGYKSIDLKRIYSAGKLISVPAYPFQKTKYWMETSESLEERTAAPTKQHPLLGSRVVPSQGPQPIWRNHISLSNPKQEYLKDHVVQKSIIYPFAGFIENIVAAICEYHEVNPLVGNLATVIALKDFHVGTAMPLKPDDTRIVETILSPNSKTFQIVSKLKLADTELLTTMDKKGDFSSKWVTHAHGSYEIIKKEFFTEENVAITPEMSKDAMYDALYNRGLMYGPAFQGISTTEASNGEIWGTIDAPAEIASDVAKYIIHPSLVDSCFQAVLTGIIGKETMIPVHMKQMNIFLRPGVIGSIDQQIITTAQFHERVMGNTAANRQLLDLKIFNKEERGLVSAITIEEFAVQELASEDDDKDAGLILVRSWEELNRIPYADVTETVDLLKTVDQAESEDLKSSPAVFELLSKIIAHFCLNALVSINGSTDLSLDAILAKVPSSSHAIIQKFFEIIEVNSLEFSNVQSLHNIQFEASQIVKQYPLFQPFVELVITVGVEMPEILLGHSLKSSVESITGRISAIIAQAAAPCVESILTSTTSSLRILEVNAGEGHLANLVAHNLTSNVEYILTDPSEDKVLAAEDALSKLTTRITYTAFNPAEKPPAQIKSESFDVIISSGSQNVQNLKSLLSPKGVLLVVEQSACQAMDVINQLISTSTPSEISVQESKPLSGIATLSVIRNSGNHERQKWLVFADKNGFANSLVEQLCEKYNQVSEDFIVVTPGSSYAKNSNNITVDITNVEHYHQLLADVPAVNRVIFSWAMDIPTLSEDPELMFVSQENVCYSITCSIQAFEKVHIVPEFFVVTSGAQALGSSNVLNINQSVVVGFMHSAAGDFFNTQSKLIDVDPALSTAINAEQTAEEIMLNNRNSFNEIHLSGTKRMALYYNKKAPNSVDYRNFRTIVPANDETNFRVAVPKTRLLRDVFFEVIPRVAPKSDEVEVKIKASAINFKDILKIRGLHPITVKCNEDAKKKELDYCNLIGLEAAGVVTKVGDNVTNVKPGDRVVYYSVNDALFKSYSIQPAKLVVKIPDNMTFEQASAVPIVFMTAFYCLFEKAKLKKGQSVLIHCASGGVGLAAIQLCQNAGATVFATAGTDKKRQFLKEVVGVEHVFSSRNARFYEEIKKITNGRGVDMIINSISGEMLVKSVDLLATSGSFFELGKRDIFDNRHINLYKLRNNCAFHVIDLELALLHGDSSEGVIMLQEAMRQYAENLIKPIQLQSFDIADMKEAFELHQKATSIGKLVLNFDSQKPIQIVSHEDSHPTNIRNGTYLITGGTGGVGLTFAKWLIQHKNIKRIVLTSRRQPAKDVQQQIDALNVGGVSVDVLTADVANLAQIKSVIDNIEANSAPLRGVIHGAAVIEDALASNMSFELLAKVLRPKIRGAVYLHHLTQHLPLEFFYMTASMSNVMALNGQTHYNAANNFLDCLAVLRRRQGLSAMSASLTAISGAGFVTRNKTVERLLGAVGVVPVHVEEIVELMEVLNNNEFVTPIISHKNFVADFKGTYVPSPLERLFSSDESNKGESTEEENSAANSADNVLNEIHNFVSQVLGTTVENIAVDKSLNQLGFDSLMSVEIRNWMASKYKKNLPLVELSIETVTTLAQKILNASNKKQSGDASSGSTDASNNSENSHNTHVDNQSMNRINPLHTTEKPTMRLICFPYMGGSSNDFKDWPKQLPSDIEVYGVDYLLNITDKQSLYDWSTLMELLLEELKPLSSVPFAFYGHSLGASVSFEFTRYLNAHNQPLPCHLFIGAQVSPGIVTVSSELYQHMLKSDDEVIAQKVIEYDLLPGYLMKIESSEMEEKLESVKKLIAMPKLIAEFKLHAHYAHNDDEFGDNQVNVPLTVYNGTNDKLTSNADMNLWAMQTNNKFECHQIEGSHLFINETAGLQTVLNLITRCLNTHKQTEQRTEVVASSPRQLRHVGSGEELKLIAELTKELERERNARKQLEERLRNAEANH